MADRMAPDELAAIRAREELEEAEYAAWSELPHDHQYDHVNMELYREVCEDRAALLQHVEALEQENDRLRQERYDALSVYTKEGLLASEWVARTGKAERERNEAQEKTKALEQEINSRCEHCGAKVYSGPPDCPMCGAPNCCQQCCQIDHLKQEVERLRFALGQEEWRHEPELVEESVALKRKLARLVDGVKSHIVDLGRTAKVLDDWQDPMVGPFDATITEIRKAARELQDLLAEATGDTRNSP